MSSRDLPKMLYFARELVFPRRCPVCDRPVRPFGALICPECRSAFDWLGEGPTCMKCGKPLERQEQEYCYDCQRRPHAFVRGCAVYRYRQVSGAVYQFKFNERAEYADFFGSVMAQRIREEFGGWRIDLLLPVPAAKKRVRERGYNQAALLCHVIARQTGIPERSDVLVRAVNTPYLKGMNTQERQRRLKNAFLVYGNVVESKCVMLIDDIYTTGSTIDACARELLRAGAQAVLFCTLAIGEGRT